MAHGYLALTDVTLMYVVDQYYDGGADESGVAWNDPALGLDWGCSTAPLLSDRDAGSPRLNELGAESLPE